MKDNLLENPADLLRDVRDNFIIEEDVESILNIDKRIDEMRNKSHQNTESKKIEVAKLSVQLESRNSKISELQAAMERIKAESEELASQHEIVDYVDELDELEKSIISLRCQLDERIVTFVKNERSMSNDLTLGSPNVPVTQIEGLAATTDDTAEIMNDPIARANILKLKLYRTMGLIIDEDTNQVIIETADNKVETLPLDDDLSDFFKTKYIWQRIQSRKVR